MVGKKGLRLLLGLGPLSLLAVQACDGGDDPSLNLTGTEEQPLTGGSGSAPSCSGRKVLVCHIPPGNPANAHSICVGQPAVRAHVGHHGDGVGACRGSSSDAGLPPPPPPPPPAADAGPACVSINAACSSNAECCDGMACLEGENVCGPLIQ